MQQCGKIKRRKKMKIKLLSLVLAVIACMTLLASCGPTGNGGNEGGEGTGTNNGNGNGNGDYNYTWAQTEVLFEMNEHANGGELTSGVRRYYAGADVDKVDDIDTAIRDRNKNAANNSNVKPKYTYLADGVKEYNWGSNVGRIQQLTNVGGSNCPDVFVNHSYDLTSAQIRGCFANLLDTTWAQGNYFYFANNEIPETTDYFDSEAGKGYFYEYMKSLSLTPDTKIYCLGSNYCIDLVRAFLVIPVNVTLMNSITTTETKDGLAGDRDGDGDHDIADFYQLVWNNEWTYDALAAYSNAIFVGNNTESANTDFADDVVGFILGTNSGMQGAAMLYTSSVKIINFNETTGKYEYPATNADLTAFAKALSDLMTQNASNGICTVNKADVNKYDSSATSELMGIRHKFANNGVLFSAPAMVGSLEDAEYQEMRKGDGFGVVPVPLYKAYDANTNYYQTLVHNIARIVAIAKCSTEKSQASAYLDYVSRNSADILDEYYTVQLASAVSGGEAGNNNNKMLTYIRNHVRTCFDKTFEDSIADYMLETDSGAYGKRWHYMLQTEKFSMPTISTQYEAYYLEKQRNLDTIYAQWNTLQ